MKQRVLAGLGAIALVAAALVLRAQLADGPASARRSDGTTGTPVVACTPDLQDICDALVDADLIEGTTPFDLADAARPDPAVDGWITWDPAPAIVDFDAAGTWIDPTVLGSSPAVLLLPGPLADDLRDGCDGTESWACVAVDGASTFTLGVGSPTTAEGLARLGALRPGLAPHAPGEAPDFQNDLDTQRLADILGRPTNGQDTVSEQGKEVVQQALLDAVVGPQQALDGIASSNRGKQKKLVVSLQTPATVLTIVLATRDGADLGSLAEAIRAEADVALSAFVTPGTTGLSPEGEGLAGDLYQIRKGAP